MGSRASEIPGLNLGTALDTLNVLSLERGSWEFPVVEVKFVDMCGKNTGGEGGDNLVRH